MKRHNAKFWRYLEIGFETMKNITHRLEKLNSKFEIIKMAFFKNI